MKLLNEADIDSQFNTQMDKIQQAIIKLESLAARFKEGGVKPVGSQREMLDIAAADLKKIKSRMFDA